MHRAFVTRTLITVAFALLFVGGPHGQEAPAAIPKDLRPLLLPRQSEMRLVTARYTLDRATLSGNYFGGAAAAPVEGQAGRAAPRAARRSSPSRFRPPASRV